MHPNKTLNSLWKKMFFHCDFCRSLSITMESIVWYFSFFFLSSFSFMDTQGIELVRIRSFIGFIFIHEHEFCANKSRTYVRNKKQTRRTILYWRIQLTEEFLICMCKTRGTIDRFWSYYWIFLCRTFRLSIIKCIRMFYGKKSFVQ